MEKECNKFLICMPAPKHPAFPPGTRVTRHSWRARRRRRRRARTAAFAHRGLAASSTPATPGPASEDDRTCPQANRSELDAGDAGERERPRLPAGEASRAAAERRAERHPICYQGGSRQRDGSRAAAKMRAARQPRSEQGGSRYASRAGSEMQAGSAADMRAGREFELSSPSAVSKGTTPGKK